MSEDDLTLPNDVGDSGSIKVRQPVPDSTSPYGYRYRSIEVFPAEIVKDLRNQLADALEVCILVLDTATIETSADLLAKAQAVVDKAEGS